MIFSDKKNSIRAFRRRDFTSGRITDPGNDPDLDFRSYTHEDDIDDNDERFLARDMDKSVFATESSLDDALRSR